jgi:cytochrome c-type biogenesis protein CcmE
VIALSVAAALAIFLVYTSIAGGGNPSLAPSQLAGHTGQVQLAGVVVGRVTGDAHAGGLHFWLRDIGKGSAATTVAVRYTGSVPDLFRVGRHVVVDGRLRSGAFVAVPGSLITKCPSKYAPKRSGGSA